MALIDVSLRCKGMSGLGTTADIRRRCGLNGSVAFDAVDGARSAASECQRVVALKQTTLRGAVHGRG